MPRATGDAGVLSERRRQGRRQERGNGVLTSSSELVLPEMAGAHLTTCAFELLRNIFHVSVFFLGKELSLH